MPKFRKKPVEIEAMQWDGSLAGIEKIKLAFPDLCTAVLSKKHEQVYCWEIKTLEGNYKVSVNDFVIKGIKGEYYPCNPEIFAASYDAVENAQLMATAPEMLEALQDTHTFLTWLLNAKPNQITPETVGAGELFQKVEAILSKARVKK